MVRKIWRFIKGIFGIIFILLFVTIIGLIIFVMTFDLNRYKDLAAAKLTLILDRPVKIESMHTKLALIPTITITGFEILNNEPFQDKAPLLTIQKMDAELELAPLLNSQMNIHKINLDAATINLFKTQNASNWTLSNANSTHTKSQTDVKSTAKKNLQKNIHLNLVTISTLNVHYNAKETQSVELKHLELKNLHLLSGELVYKKQPFTFSLNAGTIFDLLDQTPNFPVDIKIQSRLANLTLNGKIGNFQELTGLQATIVLRSNNAKNLLNFFNIDNPLIPTQNTQLQLQLSGNLDNLTIKQAKFNINSDKDLSLDGTGTLKDISKNPVLNMDITAQLFDNKLVELWRVQPMSLSGDISVSPTTFKTKMMSLDANRSDVKMSVDATMKNNKYNISAAIASNFLNIYDFVKKPDAKKTSQVSEAPKQNTQTTLIPWQTLKAINLNLNLDVKHLQAHDWLTDYIGITANPTLINGTLKAPFELTALNGKSTGTITANASNQTITVSAKGNNLNLNGLRFLNQDIKDVILQTKVEATAKGQDAQGLLKNLNGKLIAQTNQGQIINKWFTNLPKVLNLNKNKQNVSFSNTDSRILITCAAANIIIKNGVIVGKDQVALETNTLDIMAGGSIDLPQKSMDILLKPSLPDGTADDWLSLSKYIRISGPFDKLTPRVDTDQVATNLLQAGVNKLVGAETQPVSTTKVSNAMCQNVLGNEALIKKEKTPAAVKQTEQPKPQAQKPVNQKQQFEQQLLDSLFQALTPKQ
ncbi:MAG: AsmA family protein [Alphaproteobacteria bacterium]|nr:AsmA family protein [Alphaproteobacteria bacterium]